MKLLRGNQITWLLLVLMSFAFRPPTYSFGENLDATLAPDSDNDGITDESDLDDDNDGILDAHEETCGPDVAGFDAYWNLENSTNDSSGNNYNLQAGNVLFSTDSRKGLSSASFNGSSDYLRYNNGTFLNQPIDNFAYSFWVKPANLTGIQTLLEEGGSGTGIAIRLNNNVLAGAVREGGTQQNTATFIFPNDGLWHHISLTYTSGEVRLFLDGVSSTPLNTGFGSLDNHINGHAFGRTTGTDAFGAGEGNYFEGLMDEIVHYQIPILPAQIAAMYEGTCDTDNDGTINRLDTDSDGDGCPDALEGDAPNSQIGYANLDGNSRIAGGVDANGVPNAASGGQGQGTAADDTQQAAECSPCNAGNPEFSDADGDSIGDKCDFDDDNDGIPDCIEVGAEGSTIDEVFSLNRDAVKISDFEVQLTAATNSQAGSATINDRIDFSKSFNFTFEAFLGANDGGADGIAIVFHDDPAGASAVGAPGFGLGASFIENGIVLELDTFENTPEQGDIAADHGMIWDSDNQQGAGLLTSAVDLGQLENNAWHDVTISWNADTNTVRYFVNGIRAGIFTGDIINDYFGGNNLVFFGFTASTGGFVNDQRIRFNNLCDIPLFKDDDGDGIPNALDLDSDNDGIYDAVEAGHDRPHTNGVVDGPVGGDGIPDVVQDVGQENNGAKFYDMRDTDGDDLSDFFDTDSDGDGCGDADEAYNNSNTDSDESGQFGSGAPTVDAQGRVAAATYAEPEDTDNNGSYNNREAGSTITITAQPDGENIKVGENANFSVSATGSNLSYQWFVSTDDGSSYASIVGETTEVLTVNNVSLAGDGNLYRVEIVDFNNTCNIVVSDPALLTVTQDQPPMVNAEGDQDYCPNSSIPVAESISITDPDDTVTEAVYIQISSGYIEGEDLLVLTGTHPGITASWNALEGEISLTGPATFSEFEAAILAVEYSSNAAAPSGERQFAITMDEANFLPATEHYYLYIADEGITWTDANAAANASTYFGLQGYLATLTSQEEADFSGSQAKGVGWIGATDDAEEGKWRWVTGPEAGELFWDGAANGTEITFAYWNDGEPNDFDRGAAGAPGDENYAHIADPSVSGPTGRPGSWNDLPNAGDGAPYNPQGYVVEYGGMPGDPTLNVSDVTRITMIEPASITAQPSDQTIADGATATFSASATGTNLANQWQESEDNGSTFSDISGATSTDYSFNADISDSGNQYRIIARDGNNSCAPATSNVATLTVNVGTVITNRRITHRVKKN